MKLTKLGHACVRLEKAGAALVVDPGVWSGPDALVGAQAVLVTHEHFDHLDADRLRAALAADPELQLWTNAGVAAAFAEFGQQVRVVGHGDTFDTAGFAVHVYGERHAPLHRDIPQVANTGFAIDGEVFHPGDALTVPEDPIPTLLLPVNAPWLKVGEMIDYVREVAPRRAYAIHDGLLSENGLKLLDIWFAVAARPTAGDYTRLEPGACVELGGGSI